MNAERSKEIRQFSADNANPPGPIQSKAFNRAVSKLTGLRTAYRDLGGVVGGKEYSSIISQPFGGTTNLDPINRLAEIGERYNWTLSRDNIREATQAVEDAYAGALQSLPVHDNRRTPEQEAARVEESRKHDTAREAAQAATKANHAAILAKRPPNAEALIVAELDEDKSDSMTDYFAHDTTRHVAIGWRTGGREDFKQLRRAAAGFPETAHLGPGLDVWTLSLVWDHNSTDEAAKSAWIAAGEAYYKGHICRWRPEGIPEPYDMPTFQTDTQADEFIAKHPAPAGTEWHKNYENVEHRENYSMGAGNYLKAGHRDGSGWAVKSYSITGYWPSMLEDALPTAQEAPQGDTGTTTATGGGYSVQKHYHTKQGRDFWLVVLAVRVDRDRFEALLDSCQAAGGWYSRQWGKTPGGFAFDTEAAAVTWAAREFPAPDPGPEGEPCPAQADPDNAPPCGDCGHYNKPTCPGDPEGHESPPDPAQAPAGGLADTLDRMADAMQPTIDNHNRPMTQNPTPKRMAQYNARLHVASNLERGQRAIRAYAAALRSDCLPDCLRGFVCKKDNFLRAVEKGRDHSREGYYDVVPSDKYNQTDVVSVALQELSEGYSDHHHAQDDADKARQDRIRRIENDLRFSPIEGFFPTPPDTAREIVAAAEIVPGMKVLEPSAGTGALLDAVWDAVPEADVSYCEIVPKLQELLSLKHPYMRDLGADFFSSEIEDRFDRVVMNPPFEGSAPLDHIMRAVSLLKPGGRLVSIIPAGMLRKSQGKFADFKHWLETNYSGYTVSDLSPDWCNGSDAFRRTSASASVLVLTKRHKAPQPPPLAEAVEILKEAALVMDKQEMSDEESGLMARIQAFLKEVQS